MFGANNLDLAWVAVCAALVFLMQAGFLCLETGLTRNKNNINVAMKNLVDFAITTLLFWVFGYGVMFGDTLGGWTGTTGFLFQPGFVEIRNSIFFVFQVMFCGTAVTIMSGAIAERCRFDAYILISLLISGVIYPFLGHWVWSGLTTSEVTGWLGALGFVDFAGASVVHSVGGWAALAILLIIGPREGRFAADGTSRYIRGSNLPIAALGVLILWVGWIGFNGGSVLRVNLTTAIVVINTIMAGASGLLSAMLLGMLLSGRAEVNYVMNGALAGLVAVTAGAHVYGVFGSVIVGAIGGFVMILVEGLLEQFQIDDAVGAVPVHLGAGITGTLMVPLFAQDILLRSDLTLVNQLIVQLIGVLVTAVWAFGLTYIVFWLYNNWRPIRVSIAEERMGLNVAEHGATNEMTEMFLVMDEQVRTGDLTLRVPVEPFTQVGQIAERYNLVMNALEGAIARTEAVVNTALDGVITFSKGAFAVQTLNPAAEAIFGMSAPQAKSQSFMNFFAEPGIGVTEDFQRRFERRIQNVEEGGGIEEMQAVRADGSMFPAEVVITKAVANDETFYTATVRDITERKEARIALLAANEQLETRVKERTIEIEAASQKLEEERELLAQRVESRTSELRAANIELEKSARMKDEFLATMSHELRTPLNAILGMTESLQEGVYGNINDRQSQPLNRIDQSGRLLLDLINDILDVSKIEANQLALKIEKVTIEALCEESLNLVRPMARKKDIEVVYISDPNVRILSADRRRIKQVLVNLLSNAVKFTPEHGRVGLRVVGDPIDQRVKFTVGDTGIGIAEKDLERLFKPFVQVDSSLSRRFEGTGLGLVLVKRLTELHGGQLMVRSKVGKGSQFTVSLPWQPEDIEKFVDADVEESDEMPNPMGEPAPEPVQPSAPLYDNEDAPTVLLAEDNETNIAVVRDYLVAKGLKVEVARSGVEVIDMAGKVSPAIILMDIHMPRMDGLEAIRRLRSDSTMKNVPIVALTGTAMPGDRERCLMAGANGYLSKPVRLRGLLDTIQQHLDARSASDIPGAQG